jgi:hypothetical protein
LQHRSNVVGSWRGGIEEGVLVDKRIFKAVEIARKNSLDDENIVEDEVQRLARGRLQPRDCWKAAKIK